MNVNAMIHKAGGLILAGLFVGISGLAQACQPYDTGTVPAPNVSLSPVPYGAGRPGTTIHVSYLSVPFCEDVKMVGPCAMWDDRADTDHAAPGWWIEPLGRTYPDGAALSPECKDSTGTGWPCVWPGHYGDPDPSHNVTEALVFGPASGDGGTVLPS